MPLRLVCPHCAQPLGVEERFLGTDLACPHCRQAFRVPEGVAEPQRRSLACPACGHAFEVAWPPQRLTVDCPACGQPARLAGKEHQGSEPPPRIETTGRPRDESEEPAGEFITIPTEDGRRVTIREPVKTVRKGTRVVALRKLSPEEKRRRRARNSAVCFVVGALLLALAIAVLQRFAA